MVNPNSARPPTQSLDRRTRRSPCNAAGWQVFRPTTRNRASPPLKSPSLRRVSASTRKGAAMNGGTSIRISTTAPKLVVVFYTKPDVMITIGATSLCRPSRATGAGRAPASVPIRSSHPTSPPPQPTAMKADRLHAGHGQQDQRRGLRRREDSSKGNLLHGRPPKPWSIKPKRTVDCNRPKCCAKQRKKYSWVRASSLNKATTTVAEQRRWLRFGLAWSDRQVSDAC